MGNIIKIILSYIKKIETILIVLMTSSIILIISAQVILRYFFGHPFTWAEELSTFILIYLSFFSADVVYKEKGHIAIDYFVGKFSRKIQIICYMSIYILISAFFVIAFHSAVKLFSRQMGIITTASINIPKSFFTLPVLIVFPSMLLSTLHFLIDYKSEKTQNK